LPFSLNGLQIYENYLTNQIWKSLPENESLPKQHYPGYLHPDCV